MSSVAEAVTDVIAHRAIKLPAFGTFIPHLQSTFWHVQAPKPGSGQDPYAILVPHGTEFERRDIEWGASGEDEPGAACMWDGLANTRALVESKVAHPAAEFCWELNARTPDLPPLYLPALREAKGLFANGCDAFATDAWYWSSTQFSRYGAFFQYFGNGYTSNDGKYWKGGRSRPVRRSSLASLIP